MLSVINITKALAEENRLRVVIALRANELCVCQITELLCLAPSTVSRHMSILRQAGLVESWKEGRWVFYRLARNESGPEATEAIIWAQKWLANTQQIRRDAELLNEILEMDKEELCRRQKPCAKCKKT